MNNEKVRQPSDVILSVRHLKQYFKFNVKKFKYNKAVHDISFDIHKGEVFGLVGESGCGKTTTGRSIIKLYNLTSGSVYFKGVRISSGIRWNQKEIKFTWIRAKRKIVELKQRMKNEIYSLYHQEETDLEIRQKISTLEAEYKTKLESVRITYKDDLISLENQYADDETTLKRKKKELNRRFNYSMGLLKVDFVKNTLLLRGLIKEEDVHNATKSDLDVFKKIELEIKNKYNSQIEEIRREALAVERVQREKIALSKYDQKHFNDEFRDLQIKKAEAIRDIKLADKTASKELVLKEFKANYRVAQRENLMTKMQMIFQDPIASLDPRMTVKEIIAEGLRIKGIRDEKYIIEKVYEVLKLVGLVPEHATRYPHEFSGGQRQRIGVARALIMEPELIIADEPISALDVSIQAQVINLLNDLRAQLGLTILFIAHDLSVVKYFCNRIAVMYFGEMVELASSEELFKNPLHPYTRSLLSAIPHPDPNFEKKRVRMSYIPSRDHDYSKQKPTLKEIIPEHFVYCNDEELAKYKTELK
ncbi:MAG: ATP-binding cassette domain-containing protein [Bacillales bacterium]|jgi:oligopeptide transport system ATP-binding protein|nr:ATP-binding cassette domain-containing protein [Bacillales bacterium]